MSWSCDWLKPTPLGGPSVKMTRLCKSYQSGNLQLLASAGSRQDLTNYPGFPDGIVVASCSMLRRRWAVRAHRRLLVSAGGIAPGCGNRSQPINRLERRKIQALASSAFVECCRSRCARRWPDGAACAPADHRARDLRCSLTGRGIGVRPQTSTAQPGGRCEESTVKCLCVTVCATK